jgi:hypothetical protein
VSQAPDTLKALVKVTSVRAAVANPFGRASASILVMRLQTDVMEAGPRRCAPKDRRKTVFSDLWDSQGGRPGRESEWASGGQECAVFDPFRPPRSPQSPYSSRLGGVQRFSFWGRRWRIVQCLVLVGVPAGADPPRSSSGRSAGRRPIRPSLGASCASVPFRGRIRGAKALQNKSFQPDPGISFLGTDASALSHASGSGCSSNDERLAQNKMGGVLHRDYDRTLSPRRAVVLFGPLRFLCGTLCLPAQADRNAQRPPWPGMPSASNGRACRSSAA